jgi:glutamate racemase
LPPIRSLKIGIFDSGVGGLSVQREISIVLPQAELVYVADTAYAPYGDRTVAEIRMRSQRITRFLVDQGVDAIVIACNTASAHAANLVRSEFELPIVAIEPAIKPAAMNSRSGVVAVLATSQTIASESVATLVSSFGHQAKILLQACPGLVEHIETADLGSTVLRTKLEGYLAPLLAQGADTIVLGCTHYPFLAPLIREIAGPTIQIIDPAPAVARELLRRVHALPHPTSNSVDIDPVSKREYYWSSRASPALNEVFSSLLQRKVSLRQLGLTDDQ